MLSFENLKGPSHYLTQETSEQEPNANFRPANDFSKSFKVNILGVLELVAVFRFHWDVITERFQRLQPKLLVLELGHGRRCVHCQHGAAGECQYVR